MEGKVIQLSPRFRAVLRQRDNPAWEEIYSFISAEMTEAVSHIQREINRSPDLIKERLSERFKKAHFLPSSFFLTVCKIWQKESSDLPRLAASLELLCLALAVHAESGSHTLLPSFPTAQLLAGDFFFCQALSKASDYPVFIKSMSEIITRVVSCEVNQPQPGAPWPIIRSYLLQRISSCSSFVVALAGSLAAWYAGLTGVVAEALEYYGHYMGAAFHVKQELLAAKEALAGRERHPVISLPLVYMLEHSPREAEWRVLLQKKRLSIQEQEALLKEWERSEPEFYIEKIARTCLVRSAESLKIIGGEHRERLHLFLRLAEFDSSK